MALAPLLYNITFDSQTRILYFWDKAGHEIYHCEIPSPAPALPTVSISGDFNDQNNKFSFANSHVNTPVLPNATCIMYEWGTQQYKEYDTTKSYAVWSYSLLNGSLVGRTGFSVEPLTSGGKTIIQCLNSTSENITASYCFIAVCSSPDAHVITVYDSSNNPYNAFQYTSDGTDYYYVLDGTQTDWTDDLASIGYHVLYTAWFKADHTIKSSISDMEWYDLYDDNGQYITSGFPDPFTSHSFMVVNAYRGDDVVTCTFNQFGISTGHLRVNLGVGGQSVQYITYMETPTA
jgi:hypothetical protein